MSRDQGSIILNQSSFDKSNIPLRLSMSRSKIENSF